ncbi:MAG: hypothetical protein IPL38_16810 [Rhodobacter sp.]|nr:hypothetical protein [Rhodobacter sp.]
MRHARDIAGGDFAVWRAGMARLADPAEPSSGVVDHRLCRPCAGIDAVRPYAEEVLRLFGPAAGWSGAATMVRW